MDLVDHKINRVMGGKVFRQVVAFCGKKIRTKDLTNHQKPEPLPENGINPQAERIELDRTHFQELETPNGLSIHEEAAGQQVEEKASEHHENHEILSNGIPDDEDFQSVSEFIPDPDGDEGTAPTEFHSKAPLGSRYPEIFTYEGRDGELCSALSLTKIMVGRWNIVFRCESKMEEHIKELTLIEEQLQRVEKFTEEITQRLKIKQLEDPTFDKSDELQIIEDAQQIATKFRLRNEVVERKFYQAKQEMNNSKRQLFADLKELFEENNLLEPTPEDSEEESTASNPILGRQEKEPQQRTATSSEAAAYALEDAREAAVEGMHEKERRLRDLRHKLDNWADYYDAEHQAYCKCIDDGQMEPARTMFDNILLQEHQEATRDLIQAEDEFEDARRLARKLGAGMNDSDQESEFLDYVDDGYRESMEAAIIEHVDRDRIVQWMEEDQERPFHSTECDAWESRTVDLCDSVSVVAEGKERKRIDRWRSICDLIEVGVVGEPDASPSMK